ncbi:MAG TPA: wax ester/triacylglycerol synthase domain-containing protein [Actinomycetota bacterium]|nr:wax ester/triacylglycerol synthase domain-containing protein [Actinomycetota bacterium]
MVERLSPEDSRILALESRSIVGHTCKVVIAERTGDAVGCLRDRISRRISLAPSCRRRIVFTPYRLDAPVWADDPNFDVAHHVRAVPVDGPVGDEELREIVAARMAERLPRDRPLWAIDVVEPLEDGARAVIWRIHHAMADGQAAMAIGSALLWSDSIDPEPDPPPLASPEPLPTSNTLIAAALSDRAHAVGDTAYRIGRRALSRRRWRESLEELRGAPGAIRRELAPERETSPLDASVGRRRQVAFVDHPLDAVHAASHAVGEGVTINDLLLGVIAGGLRQWLEGRQGSVGRLRVQVPVSLHREGEAPGAVPNRDSFVNLELPVEEPDAARRVLAVNEQMRTRKQVHDAEQLYAVFADVGKVSTHLFNLAHRIASNPHIFALSVSNVRGPAGTHYLAGGRIRGVYSLAEIAPHHALRISAISFAGRMAIGLCADGDAVPDLPELADGVERSMVELTEARG